MDLTRETQRLFASQGDKTIYFNLVNMLVNLPTFANLYGECFFFHACLLNICGNLPQLQNDPPPQNFLL